VQPYSIFDPTVLPVSEAHYDAHDLHEDNGHRLLNDFGMFDRFLASTPAADPPCCISWMGYLEEDHHGDDNNDDDHRLLAASSAAATPPYCCVPYSDLKDEHRLLSRLLGEESVNSNVPPPCCIPYNAMTEAETE
jgi:hypothetical protein